MRLNLRLLGWLGLVILGMGGSDTLEAGAPTDRVSIEESKTSIYVGHVTLAVTELQREGPTFSAGYRASVFPYFFMTEHGRLSIDFSENDLQKLQRGETVQFKGNAENSDHETRGIEGRAIPADSSQGRIKVRVFVTPKIELIFNTTYRFSGS